MVNKKKMTISAVNFFEGGPLSILKDCLAFINASHYNADYSFVALVHKKDLFNLSDYPNIEFLEFPKSRDSYICRLYYEYFYFKKFVKVHGITFWFSLHDMTPRVGNIPQAVYCHNPSPFNSINFKDIYIQPTQFFFRLFYKYLYQINIKKNKYVIVQQLWMKEKFMQMFKISATKIIIAKPQVPKVPGAYPHQNTNRNTIFFFPAYPRPFKNIEVICEAVKILNRVGIENFKVHITINGKENKYSAGIFNRYNSVPNLNFVGILTRDEVYDQYSLSDCLIFPSKLETWGLPISEFKQYNKPMIVANLPYAIETVDKYEKVIFFDVESKEQLAEHMKSVILKKDMNYSKTETSYYPAPFANNWEELFNILIS